jgi:hypothetical protein
LGKEFFGGRAPASGLPRGPAAGLG